jgi:hypothetical protein
MRHPGTYFLQFDEDPQRSKGQVRVTEKDGFICAHCQKHVFVEPFADPADAGGFCRMCADGKNYLSGLICSSCATRGGCTPFERELEMAESRRKLFTAIGV